MAGLEQERAADQARLMRLVMQHAKTAALMGAESVPVYLAGAVEGEAGAERAEAGEAAAAVEVKRVEAAAAARPSAGGGAALFGGESDGEDTGAAGGVSGGGAEDVGGGGSVELPAVGTAVVTWEDRARAQAELDAVRARYEKDAPHKKFGTPHTTVVFGEGDPRARLMFIGEAPGEDEDRTGRPFVGKAGQLLEKMIIAMGLTREQVYIANVLKVRPPNNATPTPEQAAICAPYLFAQVAAVKPEAIVTLGLPATRTVLGVEGSMGSLRARWSVFTDPNGRKVAVMPTYHPSYVLRNYTAETRLKVWSDLQMAMVRLGLGEGK
jgi:uracil-DNA glycosylase